MVPEDRALADRMGARNRGCSHCRTRSNRSRRAVHPIIAVVHPVISTDSLPRTAPLPIFDACDVLDSSAVSLASSPSGSPSAWPSRRSFTRASCTGAWRSMFRRVPPYTVDRTAESLPRMRWLVIPITTREPTASRSSAPASAIAARAGLRSGSPLPRCSSHCSRAKFRERFSATSRPHWFLRNISFLSPTAHPALPLARS